MYNRDANYLVRDIVRDEFPRENTKIMDVGAGLRSFLPEYWIAACELYGDVSKYNRSYYRGIHKLAFTKVIKQYRLVVIGPDVFRSLMDDAEGPEVIRHLCTRKHLHVIAEVSPFHNEMGFMEVHCPSLKAFEGVDNMRLYRKDLA